MKTDKLLQLIQQKNPKRSGGALPLPKAQDGGKTKDKVTYVQPKLVNIQDPQTGEITQVDTSDPKYKEMYPRLMNVDEQGNLSRTLPGIEVKVRPNVSGCVGGMCYEMGENSGKSLDTFRHRNNLYGDAWTILNNAYGTDIKLDTKDFSNLKVNDVVNLTREAFDSDAEKGIPAANQHVGFISKVVNGVPYIKHFVGNQYYEEPINDINAVFKYQPTRVKRLADYQDLNVQPSSFKFDQGYEPNNIEEGFLKGSQQKPDLQKVLSLNTDDYDNLEKLAYGIMYNEGKFGRSKKTLYRMAVPDFLQKAVKVADDMRRGVNVYDENVNNLSQGYSSTKESTLHGVNKTDKNDKRTTAEINKAIKEGDYSGLERTNNYLYYVLGEMGLNPDNLENGENSYKAVMANLSWLKKRYPNASNETLVKMYTGKKNVSSYEKSVEKAQRNIDNNPNNNLTYSAGEKFYGALSNLANKVNSGVKTTSSKTVGVLRDAAPTPITVNALLGDIAGSKEPITEKSLSNVTLDKLKEIVNNQVSQGKYTLDYNSYFPELSRDQRLGVSGGANDESGVVEKISRATSPGGMLQNFLGQANIVDLGNGEYEITDSYDFNDKGKSFGVMDDLIKRGASPYAIPRAIGRNFGSQDNQGAPVRIKVKLQEGGITDPYIGMRKFYDDAYDALGKYENEQGEVSPFNVNRAWAKAAVKNPYLLFRDRHNLAEQGFSDDQIMSNAQNPYHKDSPVIRMSDSETRYQYPTDYVLPNEKDVERYNKYLANKAQQKSPKGNGFDLSDEWKDIKRGVRNASRDVRHFIGKEIPRALRNCVNGDCYEFHQEGGSLSRRQNGGLYDRALEQYNFLKSGPAEAWNGDPANLTPEGNLNLCLDCINVNWESEQDIRDANRLIEEGYSMGTHESHDAYVNGLKKFNLTEPVYNSKKITQTNLPENKQGGSTNHNDLYVSQSKIKGAEKGLFAKRGFKKGEEIGLAHVDDQPHGMIGHMHNHSENPNMYSVKNGNTRTVYAKRDLKPGEELTTDYRMQPELEQPDNFKKQKGGSLPKAQDGFYNQKRADELGYQRDEQGHLPSVDYTNGMWLKSKEHPTAWMEYFHGQLNPEVANQYNVRLNPEGYFGENQLQYVPKKQFGGVLSEDQGVDKSQTGNNFPWWAIRNPALFLSGFMGGDEQTQTEPISSTPNDKQLRDTALNNYYNWLKTQENSIKKGWDPNAKVWKPYDSIEGGTDTVAYGHKLTPQEVKSKMYEKGITEQQAIDLMSKDFNTHYNNTRNKFNDTFKGKNFTFDNLPYNQQLLLSDYDYNGVYNKFPNFINAVVNYNQAKSDTDKVKYQKEIAKEYARKTGKKFLYDRNKGTLDHFLKDFGITPNMVDKSTYVNPNNKRDGGLVRAQDGLNLSHGFSWKDVESAKNNTAQKQREEKQQEGLWAQKDNTQQRYNFREGSGLAPELTPLQIADQITDIMQMGHFVPLPPAQWIGLAGDVIGAPIDAWQAGAAKARGDYDDMTTNLAFAVSGAVLGAKGYRRDMWNTTRGSMANKVASFGSREGSYIPLTVPARLANNPVVNRGINLNRGLLVNQGLETMYDSQYEEPVNNQSVENSYKNFFGPNKELMPDEEWALTQGYDLETWRALPTSAKTKLMVNPKDNSMDISLRMKPVSNVLKGKKKPNAFDAGGSTPKKAAQMTDAQKRYFELLINQKNKK